MDDTRGTATGEAPAGSGGGVRWATATVDARGVVIRWSTAAEQMLGYAPVEIVGHKAEGLLQGALPASGWRSLARQELWSGRIAVRHRDGGPMHVDLLACPLGDRDGNGGGTGSGGGAGQWLLATVAEPGAARDADLTERSFAQAVLPMAIHDVDLRLLRANHEMCRIVGLTEEEMRGRRSGFLTENRVDAEVERPMRRALRTGEPETALTFRRAAGEHHERAWTVSLSPLTDEYGQVLAVAVAGLEISEEYRAREGLALLNEAGLRIGTTLDVTRTAEELASTPLPRFADFISVDLLDSVLRGDEPTPDPLTGDVRLRRVAHQSAHRPDVPEAAVAVGEVDNYPEYSPPARCLTTGRAVLTGPWDTEYTRWMTRDPRRAANCPRYGVQSLIAAPLVARGNILGAALFCRSVNPEAFTEEDLLLAEQLAARAAVCIDNARRFTRERSTAVTLQRSLLPRGLPPQSAVEVATRYRPADSEYGVGGDWFDVIPLSGSRVALVVGDVVGHGIHASATMGRLRTAVRTLADMDLPPDELFTHLDDVVVRLASENVGTEENADTAADDAYVGASCLYAVYDPVSRRCCAARAGHPPPVLAKPDGTVEVVRLPAGPPLGLGDLPFESVEFEIPEGSLLALYTDGLIQSREHDVGSGIEVLCDILSTPTASLESICDSVLRSLFATRPVDDVALLVARTHALDDGQVATWELPAEPSLVADARERVTGQLVSWGLEELTFSTELVVSELFTNAILHAGGPVQLRLIRDRTLICEVSDSSTTAPHMRRARVFDEGGRGLLLVAQLSERWGTRQIPTGKAIWAEQALPVA
ncbi:SpoIIE family protein phosphatase [Streptomyces sp. NPDC059479]|uniref:SpoIIE family protein phosphatase n=1 Tax=Streptomyces sp. NPDC059479 TaxID=3346848 RepID=UPI00368AC9EB